MERQTKETLDGHHRIMDQRFNKLTEDLRATLNGVMEFLKLLNAEQEQLYEALTNGAAPLGGSSRAEFNTLVTQLKVIEAKIPSTSSGRLGGELFQSRVDVMLFVERHVPSNSFHLFHDIVTLMESLSTAHVERKDMLQEWYQTTKVGINEASARHMASFQLVLPTVFGRTREGAPVSARHHLPALKSFKDWNNYDGVSRVKGHIAIGMEDLKYQFHQDIDQSLDGESQIKACVLAMEMHKLSQKIVLEMSSWIDAFFQELLTMSEASEEEA
jgi:hypothetical protein